MISPIRMVAVCAIVLGAAGPVFAQRTATPAPTPLAANSKPAPAPEPAMADHKAYTAKAESDVKGWEARMAAFDERARATGTATKGAAEEDLTAAWAHVRAATHDLETSADDGWDAAKRQYETASGHLAAAWHAARQDL